MHRAFFIFAVLALAACDVSSGDSKPATRAPVPAVVDAGAPVVAAPPTSTPTPTPTPTPALTPPVVETKGADDSDTKEVRVTGPAALTWKAIDWQRGAPTVLVRASALNIVAVHDKRGSTHDVPIVNGVANFNALPQGELLVRALPRATVFLGTESLGVAEPEKRVQLPVGDYTVKLVLDDNVKTSRVHVTADAKAVVREKMAE